MLYLVYQLHMGTVSIHVKQAVPIVITQAPEPCSDFTIHFYCRSRCLRRRTAADKSIFLFFIFNLFLSMCRCGHLKCSSFSDGHDTPCVRQRPSGTLIVLSDEKSINEWIRKRYYLHAIAIAAVAADTPRDEKFELSIETDFLRLSSFACVRIWKCVPNKPSTRVSHSVAFAVDATASCRKKCSTQHTQQQQQQPQWINMQLAHAVSV